MYNYLPPQKYEVVLGNIFIQKLYKTTPKAIVITKLKTSMLVNAISSAGFMIVTIILRNNLMNKP